MPQPWPRNAYMPERGGMSAPASPIAATAVAPSDPAVLEPRAREKPTGAIVAPPALATISCDGPRCGPKPSFTALARAAQKVAPVPAILSYTSGGRPGSATVSRQVLAWDPAASVSMTWLPSDPVYSAVNATVVPGITAWAAASVLSVTRTHLKFWAPCCTAVAIWVPRSYLRAMTGPKLCA